MNRILDFLIATTAIIILSPLFLVLAIVCRLDSQGPIFYCGERIGRGGKSFIIYKFRTMVHNASDIGPTITVQRDDRVTHAGLWLRRLKFDELPQLVNVVKGDMCFVGPRPEDPQYVELYTEEQRCILQVRPGITSPASLQYRSENDLLTSDDWERKYLEEIMPHKLQIELDYLERRTFYTDLQIILKTVLAIYRR